MKTYWKSGILMIDGNDSEVVYANKNREEVNTVIYGKNVKAVSFDLSDEEYRTVKEVYLPASVTSIEDDVFVGKTDTESFTFVCDKGSFAHDYAETHHIPFVLMTREKEFALYERLFNLNLQPEAAVEYFQKTVQEGEILWAKNEEHGLIGSDEFPHETAWSLYYLGVAYLLGRGVRSDIKESVKYMCEGLHYCDERYISAEASGESVRWYYDRMEGCYEKLQRLDYWSEMLLSECHTRLSVLKELYPDDLDYTQETALLWLKECGKRKKHDLDTLKRKKAMRVLYIHGLGGSVRSSVGRFLQENTDYAVDTFSYPHDPYHAIEMIQSEVRWFKPDLIVASSMGGFYAERCKAKYKILINPALEGSRDIKRAIPFGVYTYEKGSHGDVETYRVDDRYLADLETIEKAYPIEPIPHGGKIYGLFGTHDELFSHYKDFCELYGEENAQWVDSGHKLDEKVMKNELMTLVSQIAEKQRKRR